MDLCGLLNREFNKNSFKNNVLILKARNFINYISKRRRDVWKKIGEIGKRLFFRVRMDVS